MVRFDSWRAVRLGNWPGRNLATKSTERWASNLAGHNACEARAGLERPNVDADPALERGRPRPSGEAGAGTRKPKTIGADGARVVSTACREGSLRSVGRPGVAAQGVLARQAPGGTGVRTVGRTYGYKVRGSRVRESTMKPFGKPDAGNGHVRFDERGWETGRRLPSAPAPILDSTLREFSRTRPSPAGQLESCPTPGFHRKLMFWPLSSPPRPPAAGPAP